MVSSGMARDVAAFETGAAMTQQRHPIQALVDVETRELVVDPGCEHLRQVLLLGREDIHGVVFAGFEYRQAGKMPGHAPHDQGRIERHRVEGIDGQTDRLAIGGTRRDHRDSRGEHAEGVAEGAGEGFVGYRGLGHGGIGVGGRPANGRDATFASCDGWGIITVIDRRVERNRPAQRGVRR